MELQKTNQISYQWVKLLIYANHGWGKTSTFLTLPEEETIIIDIEKGLMPLRGKPYSAFNVDSPPGLQTNLDSILIALKTNSKFMEIDMSKVRYVCIDSVTRLSKRIIDLLRLDPKYNDPKNSMLLWGAFTSIVGKYLRDFINLDKHVIATALVDDSTSSKMPMMDGAKEQAALASYFDAILYGTNDENSQRILYTSPLPTVTAKDRSGNLPKVIVFKNNEPVDLVKIKDRILKTKEGEK